MPKYPVIWLLLALVSFSGFVGCTGQPAELSADLGQEFNLSPGQTASIKGEPLKVSFVEVVSDSRCPTGATCVWQGEASCQVDITYSGSAYQKVLTQPGLTKGPWKTDFKDYQIQFNLQPYPEVGKQIDDKDYHLELIVSKTRLTGGILVTFDVVGEQYSVFVTNKATIEQIFAVQRGESRATIISGRIVRGAVLYN